VSCNVFQEPFGEVIQDELVGEVGLLEQGPDEAVVDDGIADVGVAA